DAHAQLVQRITHAIHALTELPVGDANALPFDGDFVAESFLDVASHEVGRGVELVGKRNAHFGETRCLRSPCKTMPPLTAKKPTIALTVPNRLSQAGGCTVGRSLRRQRSWSMSATSPMAATTTTAVGLRKLARLVKITMSASVPISTPERMTFQRRCLIPGSGKDPRGRSFLL